MTIFCDQTLATNTASLLHKLANNKWLSDFYLAGGTALALQLGHRQSIDLDWFRQSNIKTKKLTKIISKIGNFEIINEEENTVEGILDDTKLSFMTYPYPLLKKTIKYDKCVFLADQLDIAVMKLGAIADRNTKKDFIDLYFFLQKNKLRLDDLFRNMDKKFAGAKYDPYHIYKSLIYFIEADTEPNPKMMVAFDWKNIKLFFENEIRKKIK